MGKKMTAGARPSRAVWESLEEHARQAIEGWLQRLLEQELTEFIGRSR